MKKIQSNKRALSKLVIGICAALGAQQTVASSLTKVSTEPAAAQGFTAWLASEHQAQREAMSDRIIVKYKDSANLRQLMFPNTATASLADISEDNLHRAMAANLSNTLGAAVKHHKVMHNSAHVFALDKAPGRDNVQAMLKRMATDKNVEYAEIDEPRRLLSQMQPWGIGTVQGDQLSDSASGNMTVCIIDSGYERANPDLAANNATGTNDSGTGNWYQNGGSHGTHVAGTIAAVNNTEGVVGVMSNANVNLHVVKVFNESGWGYSSDLVDAVNVCVNNGAKVVNMSLGGSSSTTAERNGMQAAADAGVLLVAASGNDGNATHSYPASYDSVMAVGATDASNSHAEFSQYTSQVEVAAPGEAILSTVAGDGRLGAITVGGTTYADDMVAPQTRFILERRDYVENNVNGSVTATLGQCTISGSSFSCNDMSGKICLVERIDNQIGSSYPELNPVKACEDAGALGAIVFSNTERSALQNPYLVDDNAVIGIPSVSVDRALGQTLQGQVGQSVTLDVTANQDYAYYNGTSMATPHVTAVAALAWSHNTHCSADEVRSALKATAIDLETAGRDDKTGYGLVQAKAASDYMAANCGTVVEPPVGEGGSLEETNISVGRRATQSFTVDIPAGMSNFTVNTSGGSGDADLYIYQAGSSTAACESTSNNNAESCTISNPAAGSWEIQVYGYRKVSGLTLTAQWN